MAKLDLIKVDVNYIDPNMTLECACSMDLPNSTFCPFETDIPCKFNLQEYFNLSKKLKGDNLCFNKKKSEIISLIKEK